MRSLFLSAVMIAAVMPVSALSADRPNIIMILADDLGRGDYSAFGTPDIQTPHIDRLFREGITFDNFYANSCVCSPTRAALLSGCYPDRVGVPGVIRDVPENSWGRLAPDAVLLPALLKSAGYHSAIVGKWHLGLQAPDTPLERGFDFFHGFLGDMMDDYWTHLRNGHNFMRRNQQPIDPQGHATDLFTDWACDYIQSRAADPSPFFLYLAYNAPHDPIQPGEKWLEDVRRRRPELNEKRAKLVALIEQMDTGIGRVLATLDEQGISQNTLVVFTSDNGGLLNLGAVNGPWRSGKTHMYEGGLRVPCAIRWPATIKAGRHSQISALTMDLFATACDVAGIAVPKTIDGISLGRILRRDAETLPPRDLYFVRREGGNQYGGKTIEAFRRGDWKLVQDSPYAPLELFNLKSDPQEAANVADREKAIFNELSAALRKHVQRGGEVPWQVPHADSR
jgi:arylsulfatase A-like enzyme